METVWILTVAVILTVLVGIAVRKKKSKPDYYTFFMSGVAWLIIGIPLESYAFSAIGFIMMVMGLAHKKEWKKHKTCGRDAAILAGVAAAVAIIAVLLLKFL